jgi:hypothetical protein
MKTQRILVDLKIDAAILDTTIELLAQMPQ